MLHLKRITNFNECRTCKMTGDPITYGMYYYEDDEDGVVVSATAYYDVKTKEMQDWKHPSLIQAEDEKTYKETLRSLEKEFLTRTITDRKMFCKELR